MPDPRGFEGPGFENPGDDAIRAFLTGMRRVAVIGLSPRPDRDSHRVAQYLLGRGYDVVPVYPTEDTILGRKVYRRVQDIPGSLDVVDVFRRSEDLPGAFADAEAAGAPAIWTQIGCVDHARARKAARAGKFVVMDRCMMAEHMALLGRAWRVP